MCLGTEFEARLVLSFFFLYFTQFLGFFYGPNLFRYFLLFNFYPTPFFLRANSAASAERPSMPRPSAPSFQRHTGTIIRYGAGALGPVALVFAIGTTGSWRT